jgi:hypothetical protein
MSRWKLLVAAVANLLGVAPLLAGAALVLNDGQVIEGDDVRRQGDLYLLTEESGNVLSIPFQLVREVRLSQTPKPDPISGLTTRPGPELLAGSSERPGAVVVGEGAVLAGADARPPARSDQLRALGPPSKFSKDIIDPHWTPSSDWEMDPEQNNFNPAKWSKSIVDNDWAPSSDWNNDIRNNDFNRSRWSDSIVDNEWVPQDGFRRD